MSFLLILLLLLLLSVLLLFLFFDLFFFYFVFLLLLRSGVIYLCGLRETVQPPLFAVNHRWRSERSLYNYITFWHFNKRKAFVFPAAAVLLWNIYG